MIDPTNDDFGAICNCAVRYCLGRRTYMVGLVTQYLSKHLPEMDDKTLYCFKRDIEKHIEYGCDMGDDFDREEWHSFLASVRMEIENRKE